MAGQLQDPVQLQRILDETFPTQTILHAFAYGSGVFSQGNDTDNANVVDLILVVGDASHFHTDNKRRNPSHYGGYSANFATFLQRHDISYNPKVYFVLTDDRLKYGIVQADHLMNDLQQWNYLYLAGRMHKPILTIRTDDRIEEAQQSYNLPFALATALATLDNESTATFPDLFMRIASLSYVGDPRMGWAEAPDKIRSLVHAHGQLERFRTLYQPALRTLESSGVLSMTDGTSLEWDATGVRRHLPPILQSVPPPVLMRKLQSIVAPAARYQSIKGIWTVGPQRAMRYGLRKLSKGLLLRR